MRLCRRSIQSIAGALRDVIERAGGSGVSASQGNILFGAASSSRVNKVQWAAAEGFQNRKFVCVNGQSTCISQTHLKPPRRICETFPAWFDFCVGRLRPSPSLALCPRSRGGAPR